MPERLAVKRLTDTDLTVFRWHFQNQQEWRDPERGEARQKAININADVLETLYPVFRGAIPTNGIPVTLRILGPGGAPSEQVTRKIIRQQKNWRLDGELVSNPVGQGGRFDVLRAGDLALMRMHGDPYPTSIDLVLLANADPTDAGLVARLTPLVPGAPVTMVGLQPEQLHSAIEQANLPEDHPAATLAPEAGGEGEVVAITGEPPPDPDERQAERPVYRGRMSSEDLERVREKQARTGEGGEELIDALLRDRVTAGELTEATWVSQDNAISPYDFEASSVGEGAVRIEVKTTSSRFETSFNISVNELRVISEDVPYHIYRVFEYDAEGGTAKLRHSTNPQVLAGAILEALKGLPPGTAVSGVMISPSLLEWEDEVELQLLEPEE